MSAITEIETISTFKSLLVEKAIDKNDYKLLINEFRTDYQYYSVISFDDEIIKESINLIDNYRLKTLDSIQLATAIYLKNEIDCFVACDKNLLNAALKEKLKIINPNK